MARRLAAILAADVVGYSRLMATDERGTHARLKALRQDFIEPKISEQHGRIVKLMGDGALVEFASVVDAVECAAAIQAGVAERQAELAEDRRICSGRSGSRNRSSFPRPPQTDRPASHPLRVTLRARRSSARSTSARSIPWRASVASVK
jgi:hypothetical protein